MNHRSYFSPWSSECAHTPPLNSHGTSEELKTSSQDGFFAQGISHTSSTTSTSTSTSASSAATGAVVPQILLQQRHTHAHNSTRPHLRSPPPRNTVTFPLTMAVAQGKYHPSNYRNPSPPTSQPSTGSSPLITTSSPPASSSFSSTESPLSPPPQAHDTVSYTHLTLPTICSV